MKLQALVIFFLLSITTYANIKLPSVLGSNMVLQQNANARLWGWADPTEKIFVTTSWNNRTDSVVADGNAKWQILLPTSNAGGPYTITLKAKNTITLSNVLLGEVWVCSGQSNMEMNYYWGIPQMGEDLPTVKNSNIRFFTTPKTTSEYPQDDARGEWLECDSNTVKWFSAVAYYFGRKLNRDLNVPIGLIHTSWGGTPAEAWTPGDIVDANQTLVTAAQKQEPRPWWPTRPGLAYNAMIAPFTPFVISGVIWYQGESNTGTADTYGLLLTNMIKSWRAKWQKDLPFYLVQIAPFKYGNQNIGALLREQQTKVVALSNTGIVITTDLVDDTLDIHPKNKRDVGYRLANLALHQAYHVAAQPGSPMYDRMDVIKDQIRVTVSNSSNGLLIKGTSAPPFFVAGIVQVFYPGTAKLGKNEILLSSKNVKQPVAVRYAFSNTAQGNIFNKEGMPLTPFRTDDWVVDVSSPVQASNELKPSSLLPFGRFAFTPDQQLELIGSAVHFGFSFEGSSCNIDASLADWQDHNYLQYEVDGVYQKRIRISKAQTRFTISASGAGLHTVWIYKATEAHTGPVFIRSVIGNNVKPLKVKDLPLIEFIGNSITCGAAADTSEIACGKGQYYDQHNAYYAYGPRLGRMLDVNYLLSSVSGIGIYRNWNSDGPTMPMVYEKTDFQPTGSRAWNFSAYTPKVVSIALGTNDFSNGDGVKKRLPFDSITFIQQYVSFVQLVKSKYPAATIALLSSPMVTGSNSRLLERCLQAVKREIDKLYPSGKPVALFFFKPMKAGGCTGHPSVEDHAVLAAEASAFFRGLLK